MLTTGVRSGYHIAVLRKRDGGEDDVDRSCLEMPKGDVIAGVDEVGRGPLAGPVIAAAVILDVGRLSPAISARIDDSKLLSAATRVVLAAALTRCARIGVGSATVEEIDRLNILEAALLAMARAVAALGTIPGLALIDGNRLPRLPCPARCEIGGDRRLLPIAAASIVAKVTRDRQMAFLAQDFPGYGWERNAGYATREHCDALSRLGVTPHHRRSFRPVANLLADGDIEVQRGL